MQGAFFDSEREGRHLREQKSLVEVPMGLQGRKGGLQCMRSRGAALKTIQISHLYEQKSDEKYQRQVNF